MRARFAVLGVLALGCGSPNDPPPEITPLIPFRLGAEWTYSIADSGQNPVLKDSVQTIHVIATAGNGAWFGVDVGTILGTASGFVWFANTSNGVYESQNLLGLAYLAWPYPVAAGDTVVAPIGGQMRIGGIDETVMVPAGTFHCILYEWTTPPISPIGWYRRTWFAPGIGLIKDVRITESNGSTVLRTRVLVLTGYVQ